MNISPDVKEELRSCPFCGGEAERRMNPLSGLTTMAHCRQCGASAFDAKWNRRAPSPVCEPAPAVEVERLVADLNSHACGCGGACGQVTPGYIREAATALTTLSRELEDLKQAYDENYIRAREAEERADATAKDLEEALRYATNLLLSYGQKYCNLVPGFEPLPDLMGVLTQIDNASTITAEFKADRDSLSARAEAAEARLAEASQRFEAAAENCRKALEASSCQK